MAKTKGTRQQISADGSLSEYYRRGLWRCPASPTGAHRWRINDRRMGQCEHCGERRQFAVPSLPGYADAAYIDWSQSPPPVESK